MRTAHWKSAVGLLCMIGLASMSLGRNAMLLVQPTGTPPGIGLGLDPATKQRLEMLGYTVKVVHDRNPAPTQADVAGMDLLVICESIGSANADPLIGVSVPILNMEPYSWDNWFYAGPANSNGLWAYGQQQIRISDPTHPLAAGLTGLVDIFTTPTDIVTKPVSDLVAAARVVATVATSPTHVTIFTLERGVSLRDGRACPARVVGYFWAGAPNRTYDQVTTDGWKLFDAAVRWVDPLPLPSAPRNLTATPGDGAVVLRWDAPTSGPVEGYRIYRGSAAGGPYTAVGDATMLRQIVSGLANGATHFFVVVAFNSSGEGPRSNEASATPQVGLSADVPRWRQYGDRR